MIDPIEIRKKQIQAFQDGYNKCMQDLQQDLADNVILDDVVFDNINMKQRTAEFADKLRR